MTQRIRAVNWNRIEDPKDLEAWTKGTSSIWLPERIPLAGDIPSWEKMSLEEKDTTAKVFAGLTLLDTIQSMVGVLSLIPDARTPHEAEVYTLFAFMESVHAKSYSSINITFMKTEEIDDVFEWSYDNEYLKKKQDIIMSYYDGDDALKRKIASVFLESFLFFSGFYWPLYLSSKAKLTNTADIIRLIISDEVIHGYYIGYKFQLAFEELEQDKKDEYKEFAYSLLYDLYENEIKYTESIYDQVGVTNDVKKFLCYNANKALMNLGFDPLFTKDQTNASPVILQALAPVSDETHDFFSGSGSSYTMGKAEELTEEDWDF